ncbi:MAG: PEP/pyruvate-binding domain-containing protein [Solirubrobacteraceae bacterium]|jgi:pyruvate,water dikinase
MVRELADLRAGDTERFGGKSTSLGELIAAGINVPPGFAISTEAFTLFLAVDALGDRVADALARVDPADVGAVQRASEQIAEAMRATGVPESLRSEVSLAYGALAEQAGVEEAAVAVRSSARGEDSAGATFAGQQDSYLWVAGVDDLCDAVRACWISLYSPMAITYRARIAAGDDAPAMGVTVQLMVDAEVSGVMFTCSPVTGDPSIVSVNASWGLGLAVVGGEVTPDEFAISKVTGEILRQTIGDKAVEYVHAPGELGARAVPTPAERRHIASLDADRLAGLLAAAKAIERHFGSRQDIEWAVARSGTFPENLYMLQSRPVTATPTAGSDAVHDRKGADAMALVLGTFGVKRAGA